MDLLCAVCLAIIYSHDNERANLKKPSFTKERRKAWMRGPPQSLKGPMVNDFCKVEVMVGDATIELA